LIHVIEPGSKPFHPNVVGYYRQLTYENASNGCCCGALSAKESEQTCFARRDLTSRGNNFCKPFWNDRRILFLEGVYVYFLLPLGPYTIPAEITERGGLKGGHAPVWMLGMADTWSARLMIRCSILREDGLSALYGRVEGMSRTWVKLRVICRNVGEEPDEGIGREVVYGQG
jgi:hypothetical protein